MSKLAWDATGERRFESGVSKVVLYPMSSGVYQTGVAWNGVTGIAENPSGADITDLWADNIKYASLQAAEKYGVSIDCFTYPDEFAECDGSTEALAGVFVGQQPRKSFGLCWRTEIGDDTHPGMDKGYKLHIAYNILATPSGRSYATINENPDAITFSFEGNSTPAAFTTYTSFKPVCVITVDSTQIATAANLTALEALLYGTDGTGGGTGTSAQLPTPDTVLSTLGYTTT